MPPGNLNNKLKSGPSNKASSKTSKTPKNQKRSKPSSSVPASASIPDSTYQALLSTFHKAFKPLFTSPKLPSIIQEVKRHLYDRNFGEAFGGREFLEAYVLRWSPSRALAYLELFCYVPEIKSLISRRETNGGALEGNGEEKEEGEWNEEDATESLDRLNLNGSQRELTSISNSPRERRAMTITCLGGGSGAELVALAAGLSHLAGSTSRPPFHLQILDIADWSSVLGTLFTAMLASPQASSPTGSPASDPASGVPSLSGFAFTKADVLSMSLSSLRETVSSSALVTLMFTLNELYSTSLAKTTSFLLNLTMSVEPGGLFLVVDSPGSYSGVSVGNADSRRERGEEDEQKRYPMQWLLDHTLLEVASLGRGEKREDGRKVEERRQWVKVREEESRWFRRGKGLKYPIDLEDMRYQYHLYQRV